MMNNHFDDDAQPLTISEWIERKRLEFQLLRASVHQQLDSLLDAEQLKMEREVQVALSELRVEHDTPQ